MQACMHVEANGGQMKNLKIQSGSSVSGKEELKTQIAYLQYLAVPVRAEVGGLLPDWFLDVQHKFGSGCLKVVQQALHTHSARATLASKSLLIRLQIQNRDTYPSHFMSKKEKRCRHRCIPLVCRSISFYDLSFWWLFSLFFKYFCAFFPDVEAVMLSTPSPCLSALERLSLLLSFSL